jgi:2',3'-cyclic-nucleotide 2'-phosphodiesterase/3'-nucleotidase
MINGWLLTEAKYWGMSLARADVTMAKDASGHWMVASKHSHTIPVTADVPADPEIVKVIQPYRLELDQYLNTPIGASSKDLSGKHANYEDTPLLDVIQEIQMDSGHADVSMASLINDGVKISAGPLTVRQVNAIYPDSSNAVVVEMTGAQLKDALEHSASFYSQWPPSGGSVQLPSVNPDQAQGVSYEIDLTKPVGDRIRNLQFQGKPLDPAQKLRVAVSSSRRMGDDGYSMYKGLPAVARTGDMRELLVNRVTAEKKLPTEAVGNWKIVPPQAVAAMEKAADAGASSK